MLYKTLTDLVLVLHGLFIAFVIAGALLLPWRPRLAWLHLPALAWGALAMLTGWICPLTPLENDLRAQAGQAGYSGGFIEHYLLAAIYPQGLTRTVQVGLGVGVVTLNAVLYGWLWRRVRRQRGEARDPV